MPYDKNLDECLFTKTQESELDRLTVSVFSYNKGQKKLQISRENRDPQGAYKFSKMGRLTREEIDSILPLIQQARTAMD